MKTVIIGGVAGGASVAARLRRNDEQREIVLFERGEHISYANCGLPYYIGGTIAEREKLFVQTPEAFKARFNVDVRVNSEVVSIDRTGKSVTVRRRDGSTYNEGYDHLVLSPGAEPVRPPIPGLDSEGIFTLRNVTDTDRIMSWIEKTKPKRAIVIGAGFIGLEMAENLHQRGIFVTIVEMAEQVMTPLDYEMASSVHIHLKQKNVEFYLKDGIASFEKSAGRLEANLTSGRKLAADLVILSIGVRPDTRLARESGLAIGERGGIAVNEFLQTNDPAIYAVGDAIEFPSPITGVSSLVYLAGPANKQGRTAADNIAFGNVRRWKGSIATAIAKVFDLTVASTGMSAKALDRDKVPYVASITHSASHAGYYPGALPMSIKLVFSPTDGKVLGAQIVGYEGVDTRIDMIAAVIGFGGSIYDLQELEHAYAPPYSSAKDPVNIAAFAAENILQNKVKVVQWKDLRDEKLGPVLLLDVRTPDEFVLGHIDEAKNIPIDDLRSRLAELPRTSPIVVYCGVGQRAYLACRILSQNGFEKVYNLSGGWKTWEHVMQKQSNEDIYQRDVIGHDDHIYQADVFAPSAHEKRTIFVDSCGMQCPGPIIKLKKAMETAQPGDRIHQTATDEGFANDVKSWCDITGNVLVSLQREKGTIIAEIEKCPPHLVPPSSRSGGGDGKTLVVFSQDLDRALASFVIATGAAATGRKVTMFFTFWGLNILKKRKKPRVAKDLLGRMFGWMLPSSSKKLGLSKLHMAGMGTGMMRWRMKSLGIDSLETMIQTALESGVTFIACQMSMDVMGVKREELIDGVQIGGVATYLSEAEKANVNLFI